MCRMRALLSLALCLAAAVAQAEPAGSVSGRSVEKLPVLAAAAPKAAAQPQRKPLTAVALMLTDDADSMRLPAFASRTTPLPTRFLRVGLEWSF
jgi:hypothetical protein